MDKDLEKYFRPNLNDARRRSRKDIKYSDFLIPEEIKNLGIGKTFHIQTYGCQGNESDSEMIAGIFELLGFKNSDLASKSDVIIINTCAIRENAENRIWGELGRLKQYKRDNPNLILGICGCMPQEEKVINRILEKYPYVDIAFGTHNIHMLPTYLKNALLEKERVVEVFSIEGEIVENMPKRRNSSHKAWVTIMYGCDEFCTYCIVPYTRGRERSRKPSAIIDEVNELVKLGYKEITILGQNVNAYGKDFKDLDYTFGDLLIDLDKTGIDRIRFTTSHPHDLDLKTMEAMKDAKSVMPYFHLPVQSGSNAILKRMNRHYSKEEYLNILNKLKETVPGISVTTDIIVGFPGESKEDFLETLDLVDKADFEGAFTFIFSPREGTPAFSFIDDIDEKEKKERLLDLNKKINALYLKGNKRFEGKVVKVLVDGISKNNEEMLSGYSEHNKLVNFIGSKDLIGKIVYVKITKAKTWFLMGEIDD